MNQRNDILTELDTREAILALAKDLRAYANYEYDNRPAIVGVDLQRKHRLDSLLFAADYIERSL